MSLIAVDELVKLLNEEEFERENVRYVALNLDGGSLQCLKLNTPLADISHIQVQSVQIPFSWYRFKANGIVTNLLTLFVTHPELGEEEFVLFIPPGNYSGTDLAIELNNRVQEEIQDNWYPEWEVATNYIIDDRVSVEGTPVTYWVATANNVGDLPPSANWASEGDTGDNEATFQGIEFRYSESTGKFLIQARGQPTRLVAESFRFDDVILPNAPLEEEGWKIMGYTVNIAPDTAAFSDNAANLTGSNIINIHSNELTRGSYYGSSLENISGTRGEIITENNIFFPVPVNVNPSYVVVERPTDFFIKYDKGSKRRIDNIDLELKYPNDGETVDLNGLGWSIILKIFQKVKRTDLI